MDHIGVLEAVYAYFPKACSNYALGTALTSRATRCLLFILKKMDEPVSTSCLLSALENDRSALPYMFKSVRGAQPDSHFWAELKERYPELHRKCLKLSVKRRWRQVAAVVRIMQFWRSWIFDYYSPGNEWTPRGKGFEDALENWNERFY
jgi:hypothetical protein